jgi:hypothetical protein
MSMIQEVTMLIEERGSGTVDDILPECDGATRAQVAKALSNAVRYGHLTSDGASKRGGAGGSAPAVFRPVKKPEPTYTRRVASVWEFARLAAH